MSGRADRSLHESRTWDAVYRGRFVDEGLIPDIFPTCLSSLRVAEQAFLDELSRVSGAEVLSLGGGIDRFALLLASQGNQVLSVDVSPEAGARTQELALRRGVGDRLEVLTRRCEDLRFEDRFDLVLAHHALHHMDMAEVLRQAHAALKPGGVLLCEEPICLLPLMQRVHNLLPFSPEPRCRTDEEIELGHEHLALVRRLFSTVDLTYLDLLTRESLVYILYRLGGKRLLPRLGRADRWLLGHIPGLAPLASYIRIRAIK